MDIIQIREPNPAIPPGTYQVELVDISTKEEQTIYGQRKSTLFVFKITNGVFAENIVTRKIYWPKSGIVTPNCTLGKFIRNISESSTFVVKEQIGKKLIAKVINITNNGKTYARVDTVIPLTNTINATNQSNINTQVNTQPNAQTNIQANTYANAQSNTQTNIQSNNQTNVQSNVQTIDIDNLSL